MKIAIDISPIVYGTGVSVYIKSLVGELLRVDKKNDYVLFAGSLRRFGDIGSLVAGLISSAGLLDTNRVKSKLFPLPPTLADVIWNKMHILPIERFVGSVDVFHSSDWTQPPTAAFKVTTIHDLVPIFYPGVSHPKIVAAHTRRLNWVKREADRIIVPSDQTAQDAIRFGIAKSRIRVIPEAIPGYFKKAKKSEVKRAKRIFGIRGDYVLMVGTSQRKNIKNAHTAFGHNFQKTGLSLVVVGEKPNNFRSLPGINFLGHVEEGYMSALFTGAKVFLYPSFYEGFGLPILEAFSCEVPVVTSNFGSMKDLGGEAAILVDPSSPEEIEQGVIKAIKQRFTLVTNGTKRLGNYTWEKTARKTLDVYREAT